jgi:hypothetical protein
MSCRHASSAPKANEDLANANFYAGIANPQNAAALGVKAPGKGTAVTQRPPHRPIREAFPCLFQATLVRSQIPKASKQLAIPSTFVI